MTRDHRNARKTARANHVDQSQLADMATLIPDCDLVTIPAGHLVHAARPAEFTAVVTCFLRRPPAVNTERSGP